MLHSFLLLTAFSIRLHWFRRMITRDPVSDITMNIRINKYATDNITLAGQMLKLRATPVGNRGGRR